MDQYSKTSLYLKGFIASEKMEEHVERLDDGTGIEVQTISGKLEENAPRCIGCGCTSHIHQTRSIRLRHLGFSHLRIDVDVSYNVYRCPRCRRYSRNIIPFKADGHNATRFFIQDITGCLETTGGTLKALSMSKGICRNIVRSIDKSRLKDRYGDMMPETAPRFIGIDEFSLQNNHRYATVAVDLESGAVIYLAKGNSRQQAVDFISRMGKKIMKGVIAVSMDMNAQYSAAFEEMCPWIKIVYDPFHIIKHYNDNVLTAIRRNEQNRLEDEMDKAEKTGDRILAKELERSRTLLKRSNYLILANRSTLQARDDAAKAHNRYLYETYEKKGLDIPAGERKWKTCGLKKLEAILSSNERIQAAYVYREMLQLALSCSSPAVMRTSLKKFIAVIKQAGISELEKVWKMLEKRMSGIVTHAEYHISNGPVEGTNNMIKTLRRQAYGFRDTEYFFLKIWDQSKKHTKHRDYISPQKSA